ncbi:helix-turn-helix transcriptional regulator, partial [Stenotrophomonas maltophilia group sp. RNC7]|uniref:helix-turn-helix transcriptional regulator n=1 Tax=Stenotrophomonas maltophilia group sp. RNC7 TaxID=3071467 RepID=UPI0027E1CEDA
YHDPRVKHTKTETVDFIVPERLREARLYRDIGRKYAAEQLGISERLLGLYENGHEEIPKQLIFGLQNLYNFPQKYFYEVRWERV